jgi:predicted DNA-binding protein with PD1-like motif
MMMPPSGSVKAHAVRLSPSEPIKETLKNYAEIIFRGIPKERCSSLFVMTAVGSLCDATLRLANASKSNEQTDENSPLLNSGGSTGTNDIRRWKNQRFEVVSLVGTFSRGGECHLHISLADENGSTIGGHLMEGVVFTTLEVVLGSIDGVSFTREMDFETGYKELVTRQVCVLKSEMRTTELMTQKIFASIGALCIAILAIKGLIDTITF